VNQSLVQWKYSSGVMFVNMSSILKGHTCETYVSLT